MSGVLFSVFYLILFLAAGYALARLTLPDDGSAEQAVLGCVYGVALLAVLPAVFALGLGFTRAAALYAGGLALCLLAAALYLRTKQPQSGGPATPCFLRLGTANCSGKQANPAAPRQGAAKRQAQSLPHTAQKQPKRRALWFCLCVLPALVLSCELLVTHTLRPDGSGGLLSGQSTFGDLPMHLSFISYLAESGEFPPTYPLIAGNVSMGYPFLCESVSAVFLVLGAPLRLAVLLPQFAAMAGVFGGAFLLLERILSSARRAAVAFYLFFVGSGLGVFYFLSDWTTFCSIFTGFYTTPTNDVERNIRWVNPIADLLIPQRATLFGWCVLFCCLYLLWRFAMEEQSRLWLPLALLAGTLPLLHTHSFLALIVFSAVLLVRAVLHAKGQPKKLLPWLFYAGLAAAISLPQLLLFTFPQASAQGFVRLWFNWANHGTDNYVWFYLKNIGLVWALLIPAFLHAAPNRRWFYGGGLALWGLCEFIVFQPNVYDNNKLLYVWHLISCALVADLLCDLLHRLKNRPARAALWSGLMLFTCAGGVLTLAREQVSRYQQFYPDMVSAAAYAKQNTAPNALFLTADNHNNAIAALAGRKILCGSGSYLAYHGVSYAAEEQALTILYETPTEQALADWGVDYVLIGHYERAYYHVDEAFYAARFEAVYQSGDTVIYRIK